VVWLAVFEVDGELGARLARAKLRWAEVSGEGAMMGMCMNEEKWEGPSCCTQVRRDGGAEATGGGGEAVSMI
jgi:hypothetical protein